jgi:cystathionine beta-lyase/cystathionine gamma-synthase
MLRLSVGLEAFDDLAADIEAALVMSETCLRHEARKG